MPVQGCRVAGGHPYLVHLAWREAGMCRLGSEHVPDNVCFRLHNLQPVNQENSLLVLTSFPEVNIE